MRSLTLLLVSSLFFFSISGIAFTKNAEITPGVPVKNTVTIVDLGAKTCIPCKMMVPILEELKEEYKGRAEVIFIDVWEDRSKVKEFNLISIPTQIFYNKKGQEVYRHMGFLDKESIREILDSLIVE
jgi:thioredoxin 1